MNNNNNNSVIIIVGFMFLVIFSLLFGSNNSVQTSGNNTSKIFVNSSSNNGDVFKIISSTENKELDDFIKAFGASNNIDIQIDYAGTLDIMEKLNNGEFYDAVWCSNSIWLYMLNNIKVSESKSTNVEPVIFAVSKSKAEELGFVGKDIYTKDIIDAIKSGNLKFSMANPTRTNTGASAYLGLLTTLAGSPEILREEYLDDDDLKQNLVDLFSGMERSSGEEDFLEEAFLSGNYDSVVTYESSIIRMNQKLQAEGKETLYALYPKDGVSISDSPFAYIDNGDSTKKDEFKKIQSYILSDIGQKKLEEYGRRTWYGGINKNADKSIFNPEWGIDTTKYIATVKYPSTAVIKKSLVLYQSELRKPIHVVFCLDYSGSMYGDGIKQLNKAMNYILDQNEAAKDLLQFSDKDKITVIPFSNDVIDIWQTDNGTNTETLINNINNLSPSGATAMFPACSKAIETLNNENTDIYIVSVIVMTDGAANVGNYSDFVYDYNNCGNIPVYSIMFGSADERQLNSLANLTNAKVFDGRTDLLQAFKEVRGYN